jgi:hypothetical protein
MEKILEKPRNVTSITTTSGEERGREKPKSLPKPGIIIIAPEGKVKEEHSKQRSLKSEKRFEMPPPGGASKTPSMRSDTRGSVSRSGKLQFLHLKGSLKLLAKICTFKFIGPCFFLCGI